MEAQLERLDREQRGTLVRRCTMSDSSLNDEHQLECREDHQDCREPDHDPGSAVDLLSRS
jgi:hypothetical protein